MLDLFLSGGLLMYPLLGCSVLALAIIVERLWTLRQSNVAPKDLLPNIMHEMRNGNLNNKALAEHSKSTPLGRVLIRGIIDAKHGPRVMRRHMEEQGRHAILECERFLNSLGTIAAITPLLGLLGTVTGMIQVFSVITLQGTSDTEALAGGISVALLTTAFGLSVAIPSLIFHRHFNRKIDEYAVSMEQEGIKLIESLKRLDDPVQDRELLDNNKKKVA